MTISLTDAQRFWLHAVGQGLLWTLLPALVFQNLPLDTIEGLAWGHAWPIGTYKHPPLQAWLLECAAILGGQSDLGIYALGGCALVLTYAALWQLGKMLLPISAVSVGLMAMSGCLYFTIAFTEFNPNVVQIPLYALCGLFFWRGCTEGRWWDWALFGLCAALGMLGKYSFALLLLSFPLFLLCEPVARRVLYTPGPWLGGLVAALIFLPHFIWLVESNWLPLAYAESRAIPVEHFWQTMLYVGLFGLNQLLIVSPVALLCWLARNPRPVLPSPGTRYLTMLCWVPLAVMLLAALVLGGKPRDMWGMSLWPFIGLWCALRWQPSWDRSRKASLLYGVALAVVPLCLVIGARFSAPFGFPCWRTNFPGRELARAADDLWMKQGWRLPLNVVMSDNWFGGNAAWYSRFRPQVSNMGEISLSPWVSAFRIQQEGAVVIWDEDNNPDEQYFALRYGKVISRTRVTLNFGGKPQNLALAILVPEGQ